MAQVKRKQYEDDAVALYDVEFAPGPLGIQFETGFYGHHALVKGLVRGSQASRLLQSENHAIQAHAIQTGHVLVAVNGVDVTTDSFPDVMASIRSAAHPRVLRFLDPSVLSLDRFRHDPAQELVNRDEYGFAKDDKYILKHRQQLRHQRQKPARYRHERQWLELLQENGGFDGLQVLLHESSEDESMHVRQLLQPLVVGGIPSAYRPAMWLLLANVAAYKARFPHDYYQSLLHREDHRGSTVDDIEKDVGRTYPEHTFFQAERGKVELTNVLLAYAMHRREIGYCQSMNFIVGILVLFLPEEDAFWLLAVLLEKFLPWENYSRSMVGAQVDQIVFKRLVTLQAPALSAMLETHGIDIELVSLQWFLCVFLCTLPLETALRVWDLLFFYGQEVVFDAALCILQLGEQDIMGVASHAELFQRVRELGTELHDADAFAEFVHAFMQNERKAPNGPLDQLVAKVTRFLDKGATPVVAPTPKLYTFDDIEQWRREARPQVEANEREMQRFRETCAE
ncbi:hypothetical protein SDRG_12702 [Saprolegnia diclina VS20]|uniref:Rab-GAP TBC domain-containing protein n=1 Tax=Saprolegnia diclina (strain VS20) TaxID=1156394 RepID=T0RIM0_SAPDV|nr:hypothetical protein SDRG_12702 [Saprolegnia diclina VS20]EQC29702.1 hypothetical protein SDRG_12702 [Saprolegnia diclina VS20]|eukprot:XP_008617006.1 hypothetical protein SDRG_12702 [Saprolegnia diclina VS20]